jgi:hypothetical protein
MVSPLHLCRRILSRRVVVLTVLLLWLLSSPASEFLEVRPVSIAPVMNQGLDMVLSVPRDRKYAVHGTADFLNWNEIGANISKDGVFHFLDEFVSVGMLPEDVFCHHFGCDPIGPFYWINPQRGFYRLLDLTESQLINGRVTDAAGAPIAGARVWMAGDEKSVVTNDRGELTFIPPSTPHAIARTFVAEAIGFVRGVAQPTYVRTNGTLHFRLEPQAPATFAPESIEGRTFIFAERAGGPPTSISFTNDFRTDSGMHYVAARSGDSFLVHDIRSSGVFRVMNLEFRFKGGGSMGPAAWYNAFGGYAMSQSIAFADTAGAIAPPETLRDHRVDIEFVWGWGPNGPWRSGGKLQLTGLNEGRFASTNFLERFTTGGYSYTVKSNLATVSLIAEPQQSASSYTLVFTSPTAGRFVYVDDAGEGYVGVFRNFFSSATSTSLTADITYHMPAPYADRLELTLGDESTGFRYFTPHGHRGTYEIVARESTTTLKLIYSDYNTGEPTEEIDVLELKFSTATSGSIVGEMQTLEDGELRKYPITGTFENYMRPH